MVLVPKLKEQGIINRLSGAKVRITSTVNPGRVVEATLPDCYQNKVRISSVDVRYPDFLSFVKQSVRQSLVAVTDASGLERNRLSEPLRQIMYELTHYKIDLLYLFHNNVRVPHEIFEVCHYLVKHREGIPLHPRFEKRLSPHILERLKRAYDEVENRPIRTREDNFFSVVVELNPPLDAMPGL